MNFSLSVLFFENIYKMQTFLRKQKLLEHLIISHYDFRLTREDGHEELFANGGMIKLAFVKRDRKQTMIDLRGIAKFIPVLKAFKPVGSVTQGIERLFLCSKLHCTMNIYLLLRFRSLLGIHKNFQNHVLGIYFANTNVKFASKSNIFRYVKIK
jgi:hypothetical protein